MRDIFVSITVTLLFSRAAYFGARTKPSAQRRPSRATSSSAHKLIEVKVTGNSTYSADDIVKASGLQIGDNVTEETI